MPNQGIWGHGIALAVSLAALGCGQTDGSSTGRFGNGGSDTTSSAQAGSESGAGGSSQVGAGGTSGSAGGASGVSSSASAITSSGNGPTTSTGTGPACMDNGMGEPNDTQDTATPLPPITDCDSDMGSLAGTLAGNDVDWYKFDGSDTFSCVVDPTCSAGADGTMRVCMYLHCTSGGPGTVTCPTGSDPENAPNGEPGCCGTMSLAPSLSCDGFDTSATVYIRFDKPPAFDCVHYTLDYHF